MFLMCSVFIQKKPLKPRKKFFFKPRFFSSPDTNQLQGSKLAYKLWIHRYQQSSMLMYYTKYNREQYRMSLPCMKSTDYCATCKP